MSGNFLTLWYDIGRSADRATEETKMEITRNMTPEQMVETQIRIASTWGQTWTRRQAANSLWFIGRLTDHQWHLVVGE